MRVILAEVIKPQASKALVQQRMEELEQLVSTYGGLTVEEVIQQKSVPDYKYYLGSGKLEEIKELMLRTDTSILILWNILKPRQIYELNEYLRPFNLQARDRVDLILKIFDRHAVSMESRLQVELAAIKHMGPRIFGMGMEMSRQWSSWWGWSWASRGLGETNTERMRRHLAMRKGQIEKQLEQYEQVRALHRAWRRRKELPVIGLVGYTNAGKSSLMNVLTKKGVLVEDKLFATLWTSVGKLWIGDDAWWGKELLVNDTVGFIRDLPPSLIQAFKSTLEDSIEADLLLHVIDASDPLREDKIAVVNTILDDIWAKQQRLMVFNKLDRLDSKQRTALKKQYGKTACYVSAFEWLGIEELKRKMVA